MPSPRPRPGAAALLAAIALGLEPAALVAGGGADPPALELWQIQGPGGASPYAGVRVATRHNVVSAVTVDGFFVQSTPEHADRDPRTSDGLFVYTGDAAAVRPGDLVDIIGTVAEYFELTEISRPESVVVTASDRELPAPIVFDAETPSPRAASPEDALERFEGMLVAFAGTVTGPTDRFGEILVRSGADRAGAGRAFREPGIRAPGLPDLPIWDGNPEVFKVAPRLLGLPEASLAAGARIECCAGPLSFRFGKYTVVPLTLEAREENAVRPVRARREGEITVASANLHSLFDDVDDPGAETVVSRAEYERRLAKHSRFIRDVLDAPDVLVVQEAEKLEVLRGLARRIARDDPEIDYDAYLEPGNDPGARNVGCLVRQREMDGEAAVEVLDVETVARDEVFEGDAPLFSRPPLVLRARVGGVAARPVAIVGVHLRSLIGIEDAGSEGARVRAKRLAQACRLARAVQRVQSEEPEGHVVVAGDFNAFEFTDGLVDVLGIVSGVPDAAGALLGCEDVVDPDLRNRTLDLPPRERYTFVFDGNAQALDHLLTSASLAPFVSGVEVGRGNADAPYAAGADPSTPLGASDHDAPVLFLSTEPATARFRRGDTNADATVDLADAVHTLVALLRAAPLPPCPDAADVNDDGRVALDDAIALLVHIFADGPPPSPPGGRECGPDPTADGLAACDGPRAACR